MEELSYCMENHNLNLNLSSLKINWLAFNLGKTFEDKVRHLRLAMQHL